MPRLPRGQISGYAYHVINRGNGCATVFHDEEDYSIFLDLMATVKSRHHLKVFGFCLLSNHFHIVLEPVSLNALSQCMHWWLTSHIQQYRRRHGGSGHIWQGRFKSFPIQQDIHFLTVLRYVLRNPLRAGLVAQAEQWPWSSVHFPQLLDPWPVPLPSPWNDWLNTPLFEHELTSIRTSVNRQAPFGTPDWQTRVTKDLGLESTLRPRGRPHMHPKNRSVPFL
jgi:REP-associated tyrosine transposase